MILVAPLPQSKTSLPVEPTDIKLFVPLKATVDVGPDAKEILVEALELFALTVTSLLKTTFPFTPTVGMLAAEPVTLKITVPLNVEVLPFVLEISYLPVPVPQEKVAVP